MVERRGGMRCCHGPSSRHLDNATRNRCRMGSIVIHLLNALLYSSVLFLIAGGLSLIYGVMRILNLAHGNLYALGAFVSAWAIGMAIQSNAPVAVMFVLLPAGAFAAAIAGAVIERTLMRPFY